MTELYQNQSAFLFCHRKKRASTSSKTALITGASSGIGAATAKEFATKGAYVLLVARNETKLEKVVEEIEAATLVYNNRSNQLSNIILFMLSI